MLRSLFTSKLFIGLASAAAVGGSIAYLATPAVAQADFTPPPLTDSQTKLVGLHADPVNRGQQFS